MALSSNQYIFMTVNGLPFDEIMSYNDFRIHLVVKDYKVDDWVLEK